MVEKQCTIVNPKGMHARAAAEVVKLVESFQSTIQFTFKGNQVPADSLIDLLTLGAHCGHQITVSAEGMDEERALSSVSSLIEKGFYEL